MRALMYLTKRSFINSLKKAVKKPVSLILIIAGVLYAVFVIVMVGQLLKMVSFGSVKGLVAVITVWTIYIFLSNFIGYASKKGIIFRPAHGHFVFPAPISPKTVLIHSAWMNYLLTVGICILFFIAGVTVFNVEVWRMLLFFFTGCVLETIFESSLMVFLYTNDKIPSKVMLWIGRLIKVFLVGITLFIILYFREHGVSLKTASSFVDWDGLQMIPVVGWNIAVYRLVLLGPTTLNVVCSSLYIFSVIGMFFVARCIPCRGEYFEDAAKFADNYAEMRRRKKDGEVVLGMEQKKRKFRRVNRTIKATGAKAIFYRQLLEYRKEKYFIFSKMTLISVFIAALFSFTLRENAMKSGVPQMYLLGIIAYMTLILTGYLGKWENELKSPYLFMIPDSPVKKLWYSTLMEHIKALADGCLFCIPLGIVWRIHPAQVILSVLIYTVLQANRLYTRVVAQCVLGDTLGKTGQDIVRALIQMTLLGFGVLAAVIAGFVFGIDFVFPIILIYSIIITVIIGLLASIRFHSMEQLV